MFKNFILLGRSVRSASKRAVVARNEDNRFVSGAEWPIEITVAGQVLACTDAGARELIAGLERALEKRS